MLLRAETLAVDVRVKTADLIDSLAEIDRRKLFRLYEYVSLYDYCTLKLKLSPAAALRRIRAARAIQIYPPTAPLLRSGQVNLEMLTLLHPHLNDTDAGKLIMQAAGRSIRDVERLIAGRRTEEPRRDVVRFIASSLAPAPPADAPVPQPPALDPPVPALPPADPKPGAGIEAPRAVPESSKENSTAASVLLPPEAPRVEPRPSRHAVRIGFTTDESFYKLLVEVQAAMRHKYPDGRLDGIFRDALKALLKKKRPWAFPSA